jgi:Xaa-Pro aminopeptidase
MRGWLQDRGVHDWFHLPFAWFGDRTAFRGVRFPHQFFPTDRALAPGMPYILDCAPVVDGYTADIGFTASLGPNPLLDRVLDDLAGYRSLIVESVRAGASQGEVYRAVDQLAARQGYEARHRAYPFRVLAHRVVRQPSAATTNHNRTVFGFGVAGIRTLRHTPAPIWNGGRWSQHPPRPGLWAVEPHLGRKGVGAKFEELLVVTGDGAFWLDDDLPHVRRWGIR